VTLGSVNTFNSKYELFSLGEILIRLENIYM